MRCSTAAPVPETYELDGERALATIRKAKIRLLLRDRVAGLHWADGFSHQPGDGVPDRADVDPRRDRHRRPGQRGALGGLHRVGHRPGPLRWYRVRPASCFDSAFGQGSKVGGGTSIPAGRRWCSAAWRSSSLAPPHTGRSSGPRTDIRRRGRPADAARVRPGAGDDVDVGPHQLFDSVRRVEPRRTLGHRLASARSTTSGRLPAGRSVSVCSPSPGRADLPGLYAAAPADDRLAGDGCRGQRGVLASAGSALLPPRQQGPRQHVPALRRVHRRAAVGLAELDRAVLRAGLRRPARSVPGRAFAEPRICAEGPRPAHPDSDPTPLPGDDATEVPGDVDVGRLHDAGVTGGRRTTHERGGDHLDLQALRPALGPAVELERLLGVEHDIDRAAAEAACGNPAGACARRRASAMPTGSSPRP